MRLKAPVVLLSLLAVLVAACSEVSGLDLVVAEGSPPDLEPILRGAAALAGFVDAGVKYPLASRSDASLLFEFPTEDRGEAVLIQAGHLRGGYHILIGRPIYAAYTRTERAAISKFVVALQRKGVVLREESSRKLQLSREAELWLHSNGTH